MYANPDNLLILKILVQTKEFTDIISGFSLVGAVSNPDFFRTRGAEGI